MRDCYFYTRGCVIGLVTSIYTNRATIDLYMGTYTVNYGNNGAIILAYKLAYMYITPILHQQLLSPSKTMLKHHYSPTIRTIGLAIELHVYLNLYIKP